MVKAGDSVVCHVKDSAVSSIYEEGWQETIILDIVSTYAEGYLAYVSVNINIKDCIYLTKENYKKYNADKRFVDSNVLYITDYNIIRTYKKLDGMRCCKCDDFYSMSEANQPDGSFICWSCRNYRQWRSSPE